MLGREVFDGGSGGGGGRGEEEELTGWSVVCCLVWLDFMCFVVTLLNVSLLWSGRTSCRTTVVFTSYQCSFCSSVSTPQFFSYYFVVFDRFIMYFVFLSGRREPPWHPGTDNP